MASGEFKFEIRLRDPDSTKLKTMLEGIRAHFNDSTMNIYETKVFVVETKCEKVAEILKLLDVNGAAPKKKYHRKTATTEAETAQISKKLIEEHGDEPVHEVSL